ncbi:hypothetical protein [Cellulomonas sp. PhB143]|uniref:hypothetical protein n=1 Tax=Cellulomonas sp. PhB143 TaxID=2485186 RepID=UPI000F48F8E4|nr:hypothetical protein [Cellulomonas sp. PhB143]ROS78934.1 hypothetical protein EDF32_0293 [Cellulomonas sp. PhB143]
MRRTLRPRALTTGLLLAGLTGTVLVAAPAEASPLSGAATTDAADYGTCTAGGDGSAPTVTGATANDDLTQAFRDFGNSGGGWSNHGGWGASDGVYSADMPGGEVAWLMNDTFLGPVNPDESMTEPGFIHGSVVVSGQDGHPLDTVTAGTHDAPESLVSPPDAVDGDPWYWNGDGIVDGGKLRLFEGRTGKTDGVPPWNFGWLGTDIATLSDDYQVESITPTYGEPGGASGRVSWGTDLLRCGDYVYVYGVQDSAMHLARAQAGHLVEQSWDFWDGTGWTDDPAASASVGDDVGASFSVTPVGGQFVLTTTASAIFTDHQIYVGTAPTPMGPFTDRTPVYTAPEGVGNIYAPYNVAAHPTVSGPGELVISYNVNSQVFDDLLADANNNRPRFVTITFDTADEAAVEVTAVSRCVGKNAYVAVRAMNTSGTATDVTLSTPYGSRTVAGVQPGRSAAQSFNARTGSLDGGRVTVASGSDDGDDGAQVTASYDAVHCTG